MVDHCIDCNSLVSKNRKRCRSCSKKGHLNSFFGKTHSKETKKKISLRHMKENPSYGAIHLWVKSRKGIAKCCKVCKKTNKETRIEWSNVDHLYKRVLEDYTPLCCRCHFKHDKERGLISYKRKRSVHSGKFVKLT